MALISLPASFPLKHVELSLDRPAQVNRSGWTGSRTAVVDPWHGMWRGKFDLKTLQGAENFRPILAFFAQVKGQVGTFLLPVTEGPQITAGSLNAVVANRTNTTVVDQGGSVYRVSKTGGVNGTWGDASAVTSAGMAGDFTIRVNPRSTTGDFMFGCNADPLTDDNYTSIDRAIHCGNLGTFEFYESGSLVSAPATAYTTSDYLFIQRVGSVVKVYKGTSTDIAAATLQYTFTNLAGTMYFDSSLKHTVAQFDAWVSYTNSTPTVASTAAQGAVSAALNTPPAGLVAGMLVTFTLPSGNHQMVVLVSDISGSTITFEPPLREGVSAGAAVEVANPVCHVALADSSIGWSLDPARLYGMSFAVEEAF